MEEFKIGDRVEVYICDGWECCWRKGVVVNIMMGVKANILLAHSSEEHWVWMSELKHLSDW